MVTVDAVDVKQVSDEVLPQVEIPEKWTQEPPCFAITIGVRLRSHTNKGPHQSVASYIFALLFSNMDSFIHVI